MQPISLVVITLNAEAHLARCLDSAGLAAEKIVLDTGSTDRTREIALAHGARVITEEWRGFGPQKRRATELATHNWVLSLDADEALTKEAAASIQTALSERATFQNYAAFSFARLSFHLGRWISHGGWYPDRQIRLYDRTRANWDDSVIHEKVRSPSTAVLEGNIEHYVFDSLSHQVIKNDRYSELGARALAKRGRKFSRFNLIVKPKVKFLEVYVWKRGFLDGLPGFIIAVGAAYSVFLKWAKLWESENLGPPR